MQKLNGNKIFTPNLPKETANFCDGKKSEKEMLNLLKIYEK